MRDRLLWALEIWQMTNDQIENISNLKKGQRMDFFTGIKTTDAAGTN